MINNPFKIDLILLHAPSVYDFRKKQIFVGPIADAVPSTGEFEMYPVGFTSIASFLERNNYNVQIINLAYRMMSDKNFDVEKYLKKINAKVFGIDLHWLPHAQGALAIAELVKKIHPDSYVLFGGLSSSYYYKELIEYPFVDFVIRGDSTEEPIRQLLQSLRENMPLENVENLTWKKHDGTAVYNQLTFVPANLDYTDVPDYKYAMRSVFKYHNFENVMPYIEWLHYPTTMVLNSRGCTQDCAICGGSISAYKGICNRYSPAYRSPEKLIEDIRTIKNFSKAPIFMIHDPRIGGMNRAKRFFSLLKEEKMKNEFVFELFFPADESFFKMVRDSVSSWSIEITLESPNEALRRKNGKFPFPNDDIENSMKYALKYGCKKIDIFFMVGIPHQTYEDALETAEYSRELIKKFNKDDRVQIYVSPLGPFLDPGSRAFEDPELGYKLKYTTLEEHRKALLNNSWQRILSYETETMTSEQIVKATYEVARKLNELKHEYGIVAESTYKGVSNRLNIAEKVLTEIETAESLPEREKELSLAKIHAEIEMANNATMFGEDELKWPISSRFHIGLALLKSLVFSFFNEIILAVYRMNGVYDVAPFTGKRMVNSQSTFVSQFKEEAGESASGKETTT